MTAAEPRYKVASAPDGTWLVGVPDAPLLAPAVDAAPDADVATWYYSVRPRLEPHVGDPARLGVVAQLLHGELDDLGDPERPARMSQIASVRTELERFVATLKESPAAFSWQSTSTGGLDIDPMTGKTRYVGGQAERGFSFFPDAE